MKKIVLLGLLSSMLAFGALSAYADHNGKESEVHEMEADANKDGKVSYDEFKAAREKNMEEHFKRRDTNGDGFIDANERAAAKEKWKAMKGDHCHKKHD
jgi:Ca2+-binding EF-hand superfamily protein